MREATTAAVTAQKPAAGAAGSARGVPSQSWHDEHARRRWSPPQVLPDQYDSVLFYIRAIGMRSSHPRTSEIPFYVGPTPSIAETRNTREATADLADSSHNSKQHARGDDIADALMSLYFKEEFFSALSVPTCAIRRSEVLLYIGATAIHPSIHPSMYVRSSLLHWRYRYAPSTQAETKFFSTLGLPTTCNLRRNEVLFYIGAVAMRSSPFTHMRSSFLHHTDMRHSSTKERSSFLHQGHHYASSQSLTLAP
jgi:hypothetical protein